MMDEMLGIWYATRHPNITVFFDFSHQVARHASGLHLFLLR